MAALCVRDHAIDRGVTVCFSGHRAERLPWRYNERDPRCTLLKQRIEEEILLSYRLGYRFFLSGMATGFDTYAAEAVIKLAAEYPDMRLVAVYPYGAAPDARRAKIESRAYAVVSVCESYVPSCFKKRNEFMVDNSSRLICGFSGDMRSGTGSTLLRAVRAGLDTVTIGL